MGFKLRYVIFFFVPLICSVSYAGKPSKMPEKTPFITYENGTTDTLTAYGNEAFKFRRGKAILFTIFTGPFGGHRIYLKTQPKIPIIYSVTLGGFGVLPLIDLAHLIFTKDLARFEKNKKLFMWKQ